MIVNYNSLVTLRNIEDAMSVLTADALSVESIAYCNAEQDHETCNCQLIFVKSTKTFGLFGLSNKLQK